MLGHPTSGKYLEPQQGPLASLYLSRLTGNGRLLPSKQEAIGQKQAFGSVQEIKGNSFGIAESFL
jgi:hypothetical protein